MEAQIKRRDAMKSLLALGGLAATTGLAFGQISNRNSRLAGNWLYQGQPCVILQQGSMLILINEIGSVGSGEWTSSNTFTVLGGNGWDAGLTAQISLNGNSITWSNGTVWNQGSQPQRLHDLSGGWFYNGQPCAILQQENLLVLINEIGSIGCGIWTVGNSFTILGGNGWDAGLTTQILNRAQTINWSNNTVWTRSRA